MFPKGGPEEAVLVVRSRSQKTQTYNTYKTRANNK